MLRITTTLYNENSCVVPRSGAVPYYSPATRVAQKLLHQKVNKENCKRTPSGMCGLVDLQSFRSNMLQTFRSNMLPPTQGYIRPWRYRQHICPKQWQFTDLPSKTAPREVRKKFLQMREKWRIFVNLAKNFRLCKMPDISWGDVLWSCRNYIN